MFPSKNFYDIINAHLAAPTKTDMVYFSNFGSTNPRDLITHRNNGVFFYIPNFILAYDQEPLYIKDLYNVFDNNKIDVTARWYWNVYVDMMRTAIEDSFYPRGFKVLANSEHSKEKQQFLELHNDYHDWYYFYHGFAALDWYRNIAYDLPIHQFSKVFITFNNIYTKKRSYRLDLISRLFDSRINQHGYISMNPKNTARQIKQEILSSDSLLSRESRFRIAHTLLPTPPKLLIDTEHIHGGLSTEPALATWTSALWHIVTETVYYDEKLHLTEKVFKPIVARRPFLLAAAPGNLAYLKTYGFKTFDRWIDESYDNERDPEKRMAMIVAEVEKLCKLTKLELETMYNEMQEVLEHNFYWFYTGFKKLIVHELVDNYKRCLIKHNAGRNVHTEYQNYDGYRDHHSVDWEQVKRQLLL